MAPCLRLRSGLNTAVGTAVAVVLAVLTVNSAHSQGRQSCPSGTPGASSVYIDSSASEVTVLTPDGRRLVARKDLLLCAGDEVRTGSTGRVAIRFEEKRTIVRLDGDSRLRVLTGGVGDADVSLLSGILYFLSSVRRRFEVETPYISAGIEGTEALVGIRPQQELGIAAVRDGTVAAYDRIVGRSSLVSLDKGEAAFRSATVKFQTAPISALPEPFRSLLIVSDSAVDWAVYYPPIMFAENTRSRAVQEAIRLLSSGDYDRAAVALHAARNIAPEEAASLQTIIAVARNRIDEAQRWSQIALTTNPQFAPAYIAASYVRQAEGDLDEALVLASTAADIAPENAYVTARLAELHMIVGDRRAALRAAEKSLAIRRTPLALFVAGLARLAAWEYRNAESLFEEAIQMDPEAPLPRLGLGLAFIRQGRTSEGAWEIERAVAHDPRRATLRVWLGRAYFDESQEDKAAEQFQLAKEEDPNDPTSFLFSAMERYSANDPIGALREILEAEKRGGARRVIRSERGLNEDSATRGAALGRVFDVLGFEQLAINQGAKAADTDPANPGAHRFLANAYRQRPGYGIAQSSELLRAQLLSPPSKTPVQPELGEADLALLDTSGPSRVTFAEFSPLFESDGVRLDASGLVGTQHTWGDQAAITGLHGGVSVSVGQFHYETDGFRANNDLTHDIYNAVSTVGLSPEFTLFGEYRHRDTEGGDRRLNFDIDDFGPTFRSKIRREVARLGFHAQPTSNSDLIGVYTWADLSVDDRTSSAFQPDLVFLDNEKAHGGQLQYIRQDGPLRTVIGGAFIENDIRNEVDFFGLFTTIETAKVDYHSGYAYFYLDFPEQVTWTMGGSLVKYERSDDELDIFQFHPKIGASVKLNDYLSVSAGYLRSVKPGRVSEQLIEPTTIAGFSQFYDAFDGSVVDQVGGSLSLMLNEHSWIGGEAIRRWWDVAIIGAPNAETEEQVYRAYLYTTLTDNIALSAELSHEKSESDAPFDFMKWQTTSVPVTLNYFDKSGLFGSIGVEFVDHKFADPGVSGSDTFAIVNATSGIRFPGNAGFISIEVQNLFDENFHFQNRDRRPDLFVVPRYAPERTILGRGTIRF